LHFGMEGIILIRACAARELGSKML
jgi:hypothetical protein